MRYSLFFTEVVFFVAFLVLFGAGTAGGFATANELVPSIWGSKISGGPNAHKSNRAPDFGRVEFICSVPGYYTCYFFMLFNIFSKEASRDSFVSNVSVMSIPLFTWQTRELLLHCGFGKRAQPITHSKHCVILFWQNFGGMACAAFPQNTHATTRNFYK